MKKIFMLLMLIAITSFSSSVYASDMELLTSMGILDEKPQNEVVTLNEAVAAVKNVIGYDVVNGEYDAIEENADRERLSKLFVRLLGYDDFVVNDVYKSYYECARSLGIFKGTTSVGDSFSYSDFSKMLVNSFTVKMAEIENISSANVTVTQGKRTLLEKVFHYSVYEGIIKNINDKNLSVDAVLDKNYYEFNYDMISDKTNKILSFGKTNPYKYENVPSVIWVNENEEMIYITPQRNISVSFEVIDAVNGDDTEGHTYSMESIQSVSFLDNDYTYKVSDLAVRYNFKDTAPNEQINIIGKYAKVVMNKKRVIAIESWDLEEGGVITSVSETEIGFVKGTNLNAKLKDINEYGSKRIVINDEYSGFSRLRPECMFEYFIHDDRIIIVANDLVISDIMNGSSRNEIIIADTAYPLAKQYYYSIDKKIYNNDRDIMSMIGMDVTAYFNSQKKCVYIIASKESIFVNRKFLAAVSNVYLDEDEDIWRAELVILEPDIMVKGFIFADKIKFSDDLDMDVLIKYKKNKKAEGIYEFTINKAGKIKEVSKAQPYESFAAAGQNVNRFTTDINHPYIVMADGRYIYMHDNDIITLYSDEINGFGAQIVPWSRLYGKSAAGAYMKFYGYENSTDIRIAVLYGSIDKIFSYETYMGVVTEKVEELNDDDELCIRLKVINKQEEKEYIVSKEMGENVSKNSFIKYNKNVLFDKTNDINIISCDDLSGSFDEWSEETALSSGFVKKTGKRSLMLDNGNIYYYHPYFCFVAEVDDTGGKERFEIVDFSEILEGDKIYYYYTTGCMQIIFKKK